MLTRKRNRMRMIGSKNDRQMKGSLLNDGLN